MFKQYKHLVEVKALEKFRIFEPIQYSYEEVESGSIVRVKYKVGGGGKHLHAKICVAGDE